MNAPVRIEPRLRADPKPPPQRRQSWIGVAILLSLGLHAALIGLGTLWARYQVPVAMMPAEIPATVQLEMTPPGGETPPAATTHPNTPPAPQASTPAAAPAQAAKADARPVPGKPETPAAKPAPVEQKPTDAAADAPPPAEPTKDAAPAAPPVQAASKATPDPAPAAAATAAAATVAPPPPAAPNEVSGDSKMSFDFASVESDTNALVTGDMMVPASPDRKYHNRKPSYPLDAAWRGEHGTVVLLIHVSPDGLVSGVDVLRSSGFASLDHAAEDAVLTWHFLPSVSGGRPVSADVPMTFEFALD